MKKNFLLAVAGLAASIATPLVANATCTEYTASNYAHVLAGRAFVCSTWYACATGSNENLGLNNAFVNTTLNEDPANYFTTGTCQIETGEAPVVGSWSLQLDTPNYTPSDIDVSDVDGDLQTLLVRVTNSRNSDVTDLNCAFALVDDSTTEYEGSSCDTYIAPQWGAYTFTPIATDAQDNVTEGESTTQNNKIGSTAPVLLVSSYALNGPILTVTGVSSDIDNDLTQVVIGVMPAFGAECEGTTNFTCTVDTAIEMFPPGATVNFDIYSRDSVGNMSNFETVTIVIPQQSAPTIDTHQYSVDGNTITFTGTASDVDGDLDRVLLTLGAAGAIECTGTATFTCVFETTGAGTYSLGVVAVDVQDNYSEIAGPYDIVIEEQGECITDTNYNHVEAGRAYVGGVANLYAYGVGSDDDLGLYGSVYYSITTSLEETTTGVWTKVTSCN